ncbi:hypothetical protein EHQ52_03970 [Leptospira koniambonensis]|uniref:Uncharacterized protein n=1 Tax=Leptospira koniambonensis TaxID=2484950 RepID=A0A4R9JCP2_9LEPT|nr:hypothetical protein [Leptospira koniambonensis]TGL35932.1 hypothetical protein EHQ52_03970 [Leptospira koniambonensis]
MADELIFNIQKSQIEYYHYLKHNEEIIKNDNLSYIQITQVIDGIRNLWLERLEIIELELDELTKDRVCFYLSGAIYLGTSKEEYFYFKSLGDYHIISDPFLKLDGFFRMPEEKENEHSQKKYLRTVYLDVLNILENYRNYFYILPVRQIAISDEGAQAKLLHKVFLNTISDAFGKKFETTEEFCKEFSNFESIEGAMPPHIATALIFGRDDANKPLREKILNYFTKQMGTTLLLENKSEAQLFLSASFAWISQLLEILLISQVMNLNPYIRSPITFNYLLTFKDSFVGDDKLKEIIENGILSFFLTRSIAPDYFKDRIFSEYCEQLRKENFISSIKKKAEELDVNILHCEYGVLSDLIAKEFSKF